MKKIDLALRLAKKFSRRSHRYKKTIVEQEKEIEALKARVREVDRGHSDEWKVIAEKAEADRDSAMERELSAIVESRIAPEPGQTIWKGTCPGCGGDLDVQYGEDPGDIGIVYGRGADNGEATSQVLQERVEKTPDAFNPNPDETECLHLVASPERVRLQTLVYGKRMDALGWVIELETQMEGIAKAASDAGWHPGLEVQGASGTSLAHYVVWHLKTGGK